MNPLFNRNLPQNIPFEITNPECDFFDGIDRDARDREPLIIDADWSEVIVEDTVVETIEIVEHDDSDRVLEAIDTGLFYVVKGVKVGTYYTAYTVAYVAKHFVVALWYMIVAITQGITEASRQQPTTRPAQRQPEVNITTTVNVEGDATVNIHTDVNIK